MRNSPEIAGQASKVLEPEREARACPEVSQPTPHDDLGPNTI